MQNIYIILNERGVYEAAHADSEVNLTVLRRGKDDTQIDQVEADVEQVEV